MMVLIQFSKSQRRLIVIASQRVGAKRRPMTGSAKQSITPQRKCGLLRPGGIPICRMSTLSGWPNVVSQAIDLFRLERIDSELGVDEPALRTLKNPLLRVIGARSDTRQIHWRSTSRTLRPFDPRE
jgi:hypothetical protein